MKEDKIDYVRERWVIKVTLLTAIYILFKVLMMKERTWLYFVEVGNLKIFTFLDIFPYFIIIIPLFRFNLESVGAACLLPYICQCLNSHLHPARIMIVPTVNPSLL